MMTWRWSIVPTGAYLVGISNFLHNIVDFVNGQLDHFLLHPLGDLELFDELVFDIRDDLVAECFGVGGKGFLDEETA
jgi:hypothetical protein